MRQKYDFSYEDEKMLELAKAMKVIVDNQAQFPNWSKRDDINAAPKVELSCYCTNTASRLWRTMTCIRVCWSRRRILRRIGVKH